MRNWADPGDPGIDRLRPGVRDELSWWKVDSGASIHRRYFRKWQPESDATDDFASGKGTRMRWRFIDPNNRDENAERKAVTSRIDSWWSAFRDKTDSITALFRQEAKFDLAAFMARHLGGVHPNLMWEFGPAVRGPGYRLVITPEAAHHLRPLVRAIVERVPAIDGWEFYEYRLAEDMEMVRETVEGRTGVDVTDFKVRASRGDQQRVDVIYTSPAVADAKDSDANNAAFVATESVLGEKCLNNWIGAIEVAPPRRNGHKSLPGGGPKESPAFRGLDGLKETVDALIGSMREQLQPRPHWQWVEGAEWTMWQLQPDQADDYCEQQDLFVGKSANVEQWTAAHTGGIFTSERFSRCGETFCYLKIDGSEGLGEGGFTDKAEIEDALDAVLKPGKLGCHIGGGTGLRYSYIDLALTDVDRGIQAVRQRLQAGKAPKRSWIQFFDSDLAAEWVGVYDNSPPPPMNFG
jgi:hypothetical protein